MVIVDGRAGYRCKGDELVGRESTARENQGVAAVGSVAGYQNFLEITLHFKSGGGGEAGHGVRGQVGERELSEGDASVAWTWIT